MNQHALIQTAAETVKQLAESTWVKLVQERSQQIVDLQHEAKALKEAAPDWNVRNGAALVEAVCELELAARSRKA